MEKLHEHFSAIGKEYQVPNWFGGIEPASDEDTRYFTSDDFGYIPTLRQGYVREVYDLQQSVDALRSTGASLEKVARYAYGARTDLKIKYREYTPKEVLETINARNLQKYGNELGPTFDDLVEKGKSFKGDNRDTHRQKANLLFRR